MLGRVRIEFLEGNFHVEKVELRALNTITELLNCIPGPSNLGVRGPESSWPLPWAHQCKHYKSTAK